MKPSVRKEIRRWARRLLWVAGGFVVLVMVVALGLAWRLHRGPIHLDFLIPRIDQALDELVAPASVTVGGMTLEWVGGRRAVIIQAVDVELLSQEGNRIARFGGIGVGLHGAALLRGQLVLRGLVLRRTKATLLRNEDGSFGFDLGDQDEASEDKTIPGLSAWLDQWVEPEPGSLLARLKEISIEDSRIAVHDQMTGVDWSIDQVDLSVKRQDGSLHGRLSMNLDAGDHQAEFNAEAVYQTSTREVEVKLRFEDLVPSVVAKDFPGLESLHGFDTVLSGSVDVTLADATRLTHLEAAVKFAGNHIEGSLSRDPQAGYRIRITGSSFDASPLIDYLKTRNTRPDELSSTGSEPSSKKRPALELEIRLDQLVISETSNLNHFSARVLYDGEKLDELKITAEVKSTVMENQQTDKKTDADPDISAKVNMEFIPDEEGHRIRFETDNMGTLFEGLHVSTALRGGTVTLAAERASPGEPFQGQLEAMDFTLIEAPALAKILELGSIRGMAKAFAKEGLGVEKVNANLTFNRHSMEIGDGKILGNGFGITVEGKVDFGKDGFNLKGAVTPMETIQKVIGRIPLIGRILSGWDREGIIAVLYSIKGPLDDPEIQVKSFSALTPGITREIFKLAPDDDNKEDKKED